jgi:membrane protease YdiL (CAAX protease family)
VNARRKERQAAASRHPASRLGQWLPAPPEGAASLDQRTTFVLILATLLLVVFQYFGKPESYRGFIAGFWAPLAANLFGDQASMAPFVHWGVSSIVLRVLVPFAVILFVFREPLSHYGWKWRGTLKHAPLYVAMYAMMVPLIVWASTQASFLQKYPFYKGAAAGGPAFWGYELFYGAQFLGVEFFFRGFLTFALFRKFGYNALLIMAIPYVMVHFNKPLPETLGALGAALILGALALRAGSCIPGFFLHWAVGLTMDALAVRKMLG